MEFEWDASKELANIRKHKVSFTEAVEAFFDPNSFQMTDLKHSGREPRCYWVGKIEPRSNFDNVVYQAWGDYSNYRICGVETISEALQ